MPINFPSNLKATNGDFALIQAEDTAIQGWTHVATVSQRNELQEATMRCPGAVVVVGTIPYIYTSTDVTDGPWGNVDNWERLDEAGGSETIEGLTDVNVTSPQPNQVLLWDNNGSVWVNETLAYGDLAGTPVLGLVATTNLYSDLDSLPVFGLVAETNLYSDLDSLPVLGLAAETNLYGDLDEKPTFVASTGITINETVNAAGGTAYTFISTGGPGGGDATIAGGLGQFDDTNIVAPATNDVLIYNGVTFDWENQQLAPGLDTLTVSSLTASGNGSLTFDGTNRLFFTPADVGVGASVLGDLTDVDTAGATTGQVLEYDGADWVAATPSAGGAVDSVNGETGVVIIDLDNIEGVVAPSPATGDVLVFNGLSWVNQAPPSAVGDALVANGIDQFADVGYAGTPSSGQMLEWVGTSWRNVASSKLDSLQINTAVASGNGSLSFDGSDELTFTPADVPSALGDLSNVDTGGAASGDILEYDGADWVVATPSGSSGPITLAYNGNLDAAIAKTYYLTAYAPASQTVTNIKAICGAGSCTVDFFIFGNLLVHTQTVNTGTTQLVTPSGISSIPAGSELTMVISNVVGCFDFRFSMVYTQ